VYSSDNADVLLDVFAYFTDDPVVSNLTYYPVTPCRVADTRDGARPAGFGPPRLAGGASREFNIPSSGCGIPNTAKAYSLNITAVPPSGLSFLTTWPTGVDRPLVSTLAMPASARPAASIRFVAIAESPNRFG
jgi:hypothetical protein